MSEPTGYLTQAQMTTLAEILTAAGWPVELVIEDALDTPYEWDAQPPAPSGVPITEPVAA